MCCVLEVARSGYYDWLKQPVSNRTQEDARLLRLIRAPLVASHGIYGAPRIFLDLREAGETCTKHTRGSWPWFAAFREFLPYIGPLRLQYRPSWSR